MKKSLTLITALALSATMFTGCKKDDEAPFVKEEALAGATSKSWKTIAYKINGVEAISSFKACDIDDLEVFYKIGKYEITEGASKCNSSDNQVISTGVWGFNSDKTTLTTTTGSDEKTYHIDELSEKKMVLSRTDGSNSIQATLEAQ